MNQYVMIDVSHCGHEQKLRAFANEVNNFVFAGLMNLQIISNYKMNRYGQD